MEPNSSPNIDQEVARPQPRFSPHQCVMTRWGKPVWIDGEPHWDRARSCYMYNFDYNLGFSEGLACEGDLRAYDHPLESPPPRHAW